MKWSYETIRDVTADVANNKNSPTLFFFQAHFRFLKALRPVSDGDSKAGSISGGTMLPWGAHKERSPYPSCVNIDVDIKPGEFVMRTLFADFTVQAERKMDAVMNEPLVSLPKCR